MPEDQDPTGWKVTIKGAEITIYTDGWPYCPDVNRAWLQAMDKIRIASKEAGVFIDQLHVTVEIVRDR